ncbi:MAG: hypothetical protein H0W48_00065 [Methylibium sp.]|nr:hypothetical protein [Methylibium sp.]
MDIDTLKKANYLNRLIYELREAERHLHMPHFGEDIEDVFLADDTHTEIKKLILADINSQLTAAEAKFAALQPT